MKEIQFIKDCYKNFLWSGDNSEYFEDDGISIYKSGSSSRDMNVCIVDKISDFSHQKKIFEDSFNVNGIVFSFPSSRFMIRGFSNNLIYCGKVGVLWSNGILSKPQSNQHNITRVSEDNVNDFIDFLSTERKIEKNILQNIIKNNFQNIHAYISYMNNKVAGIGYAIEHNKNVLILDTIVKEEYRNSRILTEIGEVSMFETTKSGVSNFISIVSSNYSQKVAEKIGFKEMIVLDLWINKES